MPPPGGQATGLVRHPQKDHLITLSRRKHRRMLQGLVATLDPLPASFDCRTQGWVGPIKDQSQCGSCWDFSGTCVVECAHYKAGTLTNDGSQALSEQYTLDCGRNGGCNGDDNVTVLEWAKKTGLPKTSDYGPYHASPHRCSFQETWTLYKVDDWGFTDGTSSQSVSSTDGIKRAMLQYGVIGCAVDAGFSDPGSGVISGGGSNIDHDVALVGWDDSKGHHGAWIMRNSWGTGWGNGGYAWIEYGAYSIGTEAVWALVNAVNPPIDWYF